MQRAFERADYPEVIAVGRHAVRTGKADARVHYYYGLALAAVGREHEGFSELDAAAASDSSLAEPAADFLWREPAAAGANPAQRWRKAIELWPRRDPGARAFAVGDAYFADRRYADAAHWYQRATVAYPDSSACERAYSRLAQCWSQLGDADQAKQAMETLVKRFPRGRLAGGASSSLEDMTFAEAQKASDEGNYEEAITLAQGVVDRASNRLLQQKARMLLGSCYEATGDRQSAYAAYRELVRNDRGDSGRLVEQAKARIEALQEAGVK